MDTRVAPKVAIIVLNWNGWQDTIECLESLRRITYPNYQVIVVDNGSADDSVERITTWAQDRFGLADTGTSAPDWDIVMASPEFTFMAAGENLGFSGGNNLGIKYALFGPYPADFVFLLNNDARPEPACITVCVEVAQKADAGVVGAVIMSEKGKVLFAGSRFPRGLFMADLMPLSHTADEYWRVDSVQGCAMLIRRDLLARRKREYGYFLDPKLFMYCEETEFCVCAREWGYEVFLAKNAVVHHNVAGSSGKGSPLSYYYLTRNRILLAKKLLPLWLRILFHIWYVPSRLVRALQRRVEGKPLVSGAILEGLLDGYADVTGKWEKHIE